MPEKPPAPALVDKPFENCYWVKPGRLLAGEYPAVDSKRASTKRLRNLLDAGVRTFIDLTQEGEMPEYASLLPARSQARHLRFGIEDHDVPASAAHMKNILDAIDQSLARGEGVYVHCRAGIGRTGTVIGCHLVRGGCTNENALETLNDLWQQCARADRWPSVPETAEQRHFIRHWKEIRQAKPTAGAAQPGSLQRFEACLLGLAIGDAFGAQMQTQLAGIWGSDTAMTWCLAESLLEKGDADPEDQMQRYLRWQRQGEYSPPGVAVTAPKEVQRALAAWQWNRKPLAGSHDPANLDVHPLARTAAVALRYAHEPAKALHIAAEVSRTTLQSPVVLDACRLFAALLISLLNGASKEELLKGKTPALAALHETPLKDPVAELAGRGGRALRAKKNPIDAVSVLASAWRAFNEHHSFHAGLQAVTQGTGVPASAGALYGALAGAHYGVDALPGDARRQLAQAAVLSKLVLGLHTAASKQ